MHPPHSSQASGQLPGPTSREGGAGGGPRAPGSGAAPDDGWQDYLELKLLLRALGDVVRLNIVHALAPGGEVKVTELAERLTVSQPLVSWNLTVLRRAGLVQRRRQGREVYCSLDLERYQTCVRLLTGVIAPVGASAPTTTPTATQAGLIAGQEAGPEPADRTREGATDSGAAEARTRGVPGMRSGSGAPLSGEQRRR